MGQVVDLSHIDTDQEVCYVVDDVFEALLAAGNKAGLVCSEQALVRAEDIALELISTV